MYASYRDHVQFLVVYIREAHPNLLPEDNETGVVGQPKDLKERIIVATQCVSQYQLTLLMVLDGMDGKVNRDYQAAPVRVTVVDIDGKVAFYAGRGPADFRIPPVERTLKKLVANNGRMPPPPAPHWGEPVNGLCCGLSFDPPKLTLGEDVVIRVAFRNTTDAPMSLHYDLAEVAQSIVIRNDKGQTLRVRPVTGARPPRTRGPALRESDNNLLRGIGPGQMIECEMECRVAPASERIPLIAGPFQAVYRFVSAEATPQAAWTGRITSGLCPLEITPAPRQDHDPNSPSSASRVR